MMMRYFQKAVALVAVSLCICGAASAQTPQAPDGAQMEREVTSLQSELAAATARMTELEGVYGDLPWTRDKTDEFVALGRSVDALRAQIIAIGARLAGLTAANAAVAANVSVAPLRASLDTYGGPPLPATVAEGAALAFETTVRHPAGDSPHIANLSWRVLDSAGRPLPGIANDQQVAESGTTKSYGFTFRLGDFPNGKYRMVFTYTPVLDQTQAVTVESGFTISQPIRIARVVVSPDTAATQHANTLYVEQVPHLFVYFSAGDLSAVSVDFVLRAADGSERYRKRVERPLKPGEAETRVGLLPDPGIVREGDDLVFSATLIGPDGFAVSREVPFAVRGHTASINLAARLTSNEPVPFSIEAPSYFTPPLRVELSPSSATASLTGATSGTLVAIGDGDGALRAMVTDAQGRIARARASFVIVPAQPPAVAATPPAQSNAWVTALDSTQTPQSDDWVTALDSTQPAQAPPPPEPPQPAGPTIAEALATFQSQVAQIQADKQAGLDAIQDKQQTEMQNFLQKQQGAQNTLSAQGKAGAATVYWVVYVEDICGPQNGLGCPSVSVTSGPQPPATGFSNPNPSAPGRFLRVTKAYGTLSAQEAQRIAAGIQNRTLSTSDYFPITRRSVQGYEGFSGPLVRHGPGVQAR
ncbi:MAG: hypothetical protein IT566_11390 [Rhodospirillaceae bacterium]|nr:hypothetical protein [Rhodospirillaceae bacterium]